MINNFFSRVIMSFEGTLRRIRAFIFLPPPVYTTLKLAIYLHGDQRIKYTNQPYWFHLDQVAWLLIRTGRKVSKEQLCAAYLHDTLEDVVPTYSASDLKRDISSIPGIDHDLVVSLVEELTDQYIKSAYPHLNRAQRKALENERLSKISDKAKLIKLCDFLSNFRSITKYDEKFATVFAAEFGQLQEAYDLFRRIH